MKRNKVMDRLAYVGLRLVIALIQSTSLENCQRVVRVAAFALARWLPLRRTTIDENLRMVIPGVTQPQLLRLREAMWEHLLLMICEIAHAPRKIHRTNWRDHFYIPHKNEMFRVLMGQRPTILVTGHFGNFELAGFATGLFGIPSTTIARPLDNPYVHDYVTRFRSLGGQHMLDKEGSAVPVQEILQAGGALALLADQHAGPKGCWTEFLGQPASCHKALALFVLTSGAAMVVSYNRRLQRPLQFELGTTGIAHPDAPGEHLASVKALTSWYNRCLERAIRPAPQQYWWVHRRWREPPPKVRSAA
ncbi:MAG: lysophospholipid acyltransferase family protein [Aureliella sp.]